MIIVYVGYVKRGEVLVFIFRSSPVLRSRSAVFSFTNDAGLSVSTGRIQSSLRISSTLSFAINESRTTFWLAF